MAEPSVRSPDYRPRLRPGLAAAPNGTPDTVALFDPNRITRAAVTLPRRCLDWVALFTGSRTLREVQVTAAVRGGSAVPLGELAELVSALDEAMLLDGPTFRAYLFGPVRRPACVGCYPDDPAAIRATLGKLFTGPGGPGLPDFGAGPSPHGRLRAALLPHMDYVRGGVTYGWGFKELAERTDARLFVIVATSHYSPHRFTLTRMNFETPLGTVETDQAYIDRLEKHFGDGLFDDPVAHLPEHSVELEVLPLQYLFEGRREVRIVALLVGSFQDRVLFQSDPAEADDIGRMVTALRRAEAEAGEPVCYLISGDLAHIGPKFGDPLPVSASQLETSRAGDELILNQLTAADPDGYFRVIAEEEDARRICGFPPTWLTLAAARPRTGRVLHYNRSVHPT
ncbi:MAG TPA: AmmeMemoRadiSam system protein B, partial [Fimbriiglobus sp.]|nr:AmmeMemoRadiSam system protein B [Fimbriiglobus sp.]